jgi:hypothetical protein
MVFSCPGKHLALCYKAFLAWFSAFSRLATATNPHASTSGAQKVLAPRLPKTSGRLKSGMAQTIIFESET